jgi:hypothetical protein
LRQLVVAGGAWALVAAGEMYVFYQVRTQWFSSLRSSRQFMLRLEALLVRMLTSSAWTGCDMSRTDQEHRVHLMGEDGLVTVLLIATSPRSTWITARDEATARRVREVLGPRAADVRRRGVFDPLAVDVGVGVGVEAGDLLLAEGFTFGWHDDQHPLNRESGTAWGIPVTE